MADRPSFPVLFTIDGSNRHEVILISRDDNLSQLKQSIETIVTSSPNAAEVLHKYRSKETTDAVKEIRVKWAGDGRDMALYPKSTVLTEENCQAVLRLMEVGIHKDVLDIKVESKK